MIRMKWLVCCIFKGVQAIKWTNKDQCVVSNWRTDRLPTNAYWWQIDTSCIIFLMIIPPASTVRLYACNLGNKRHLHTGYSDVNC